MTLNHPDEAFNLDDCYVEEYSNVLDLYQQVQDMVSDFRKDYGNSAEGTPNYKPVFEKMDETQGQLEDLGRKLDPQTNPNLAKELRKISTDLAKQTKEIGRIYLDEPIKAPDKKQTIKN